MLTRQILVMAALGLLIAIGALSGGGTPSLKPVLPAQSQFAAMPITTCLAHPISGSWTCNAQPPQ
ncbi:hypothetical protein [Shimia sp. SDUM112013]|uniref:hypothetical protein n=1 Tax=Shimia sp. SDUM112013 TaxID=3136160 RepID=UPI0032F01B45